MMRYYRVYRSLQYTTSFFSLLVLLNFPPFIPWNKPANYEPNSAKLKVPKCEIFDLSDFPNFYTIKSLRVGDFGIKIKKI